MVSRFGDGRREGSDPLHKRLAQLQANDKPVLVYSTFPSPAEAERVGGLPVDQGLAACVNLFPGMTAIRVWEGKRQRERETARLVKTRAVLAAQV
jgi:periplasmic divalent cation tolerance protein